MARFHTVLGWLVLAGYVAVVVIHGAWNFPGLGNAAAVISHVVGNKAGTGIFIAYALPLVAASCFLCPQQWMWRLSPRTPPSYDYVLGESFWYAIGYFVLAVSVGVLFLFR